MIRIEHGDCLEVIPRLAFLIVFGGARTHHRVWCAIEDAGFIIQDTIMWLFASGFPKRRDNLKPAMEPICLAYKPGGDRTMQVDECRIGLSGDPQEGRWPANVCHDGSDEVLNAFAKYGESSSNRGVVTSKPGIVYGGGKGLPSHTGEYGFNDSGSAARFFFSAKALGEDRLDSKHPTIKPRALIHWLVKLVTPKGGVVLDPFAGSGTTGVAARIAGRNAILIEKEALYIEDIKRRVVFQEGFVDRMAKQLEHVKLKPAIRKLI